MKMILKPIKFILTTTLVVTFLVSSIGLAGGPKSIKKYSIPDHGVLELNVPTSWKGPVHKPQENMPPTIIFKPALGNDFEVLITVLWGTAGEKDFNNPAKVRTLVENDGQKILPKSVENRLVVQQIRGINNIGYLFSLTDKAPNPGEFRYITRGGIAVGNLLLNVTILYRVKDSPPLRDALSMLCEARQSVK